MNAIISIAKTTVGEAIRRRVLLVILLIGVLFLIVTPGLTIMGAKQSEQILKSITLGVIQLTSAVIAIVLTVYLIPNEIERRTIYTILSKPVQRWQFLIGKYLGAVAAMAMMMALMTVTMLFVFWLMSGNRIGTDALAGLARVPVMFFVQMSLLAAVALFFSTFVSPIVNFFLSGGIYMVGTFFNPLFTSLGDSKNTPFLAKAGAIAIHTIVPNFADFNVANPIINPGAQIKNEQMYYLQLVAYAAIYIALLMIGGILIFDRREV